MGDWYYIGHYGQLGPLTREQIDDLIEGGVIARDTYVWKTGMSDWIAAERVAELQPAFAKSAPFAPPPPPMPGTRPSPPTTTATAGPVAKPQYFATDALSSTYSAYPYSSGVRSDRNRALAGVLQLVLPGVGRIYLGYGAIGVLQLVLSMCGGVGYIWSIIDGIIILTGGLRVDGYGRDLPD